MRVIAVAMQKGGVGKTTSVFHIATGLADAGQRVAVVDLDPQSQQAQLFGITIDAQRTAYQVLMNGDSLESCAYPGRGVSVIPQLPGWDGADVELSAEHDGRHRLKIAVDAARARGAYDYVVVDTPPNLGALTANALVAATDVLVPVTTHQAVFNELPKFLKVFEKVKQHFNPGVKLLGLLPTMYAKTNSHDTQILALLKNNPHGYPVFEPVTRTTRLADCFSRRLPAFDFDRAAGWPYEKLVERIAAA